VGNPVMKPLGSGERRRTALADPGAGEVRGCLEASRRRPGLGCLLLVVAMLALGLSQVEAAYRLTFQNGTSVEVQWYEDLGDAIRYPRLGGVVVLPKSSVSAIEEAVHLPPPSSLSTAPSTTRTAAPEARSDARPASALRDIPRVTMPPIQTPVLHWQGRGHAPVISRTVQILTGIALFSALVAVVVFFMATTRTGPWDEGEREVAGSRRTARREDGRPRGESAGRPLGVVLVGVYDALFGILMMSVGVTGAVVGQVIADMPVFLFSSDDPIAIIVLSLIAIAFGALVLAAAYGMWSLQTWGWRLQVVVCFTDVILNAYALLANPPSADSLFAVVGQFVDSAILIYLSRPRLRELYANDARDTEDGREPTTEREPITPSL
jgi:hypothetical protein